MEMDVRSLGDLHSEFAEFQSNEKMIQVSMQIRMEYSYAFVPVLVLK